MAYELSRACAVDLGWYTGSKTSYDLSVAFSMGTSGRAIFIRFIAPTALSAGTLTAYLYCSAVTGSPTDVRAAVWNGPQGAEDVDNPNVGGSAIATSGAVDCSSAAGTWVTFTITGVTLTAGYTYFIVVDNRTASPDANYPSFVYRSAASPLGMSGISSTGVLFQTGYTADGFTAGAPTAAVNPCGVVKIGSGDPFGNPYADTFTHASNANDRGNRYQFAEDMMVSGVTYGGAIDSNILTVEINRASDGVNVVSVDMTAGDTYRLGRGTCVRFSPVTLAGGVAYDVVITLAASRTIGTIYYMGEASPPADVVASRPAVLSYVDGATPGSYTEETNKVMRMTLLIDNSPAIDTPAVGNVTEDDTVRGSAGTFAVPGEEDVASGVQYGAGGTEFEGTLVGGGGGGLLTHPGMTGGISG